MERHVNPEEPDLYALGALDGEDKQAFEAHVRSCSACARELAAARQRMALLGLTAPLAIPPPRAKDGMLRRVRLEAHRDLQVRLRRLLWLTPTFALGFCIAAVVAVTLYTNNLRYQRQIRDLQGQLAAVQTRSQEVARASEETEKLLGMPGTVRVALKPVPGMPWGRAGVLYNAKMGMVTCAGWLPAAPPNKSYQFWLVPMKGKPVSLGVLSHEWEEPMSLHVTPGMEAKAFAVTEEPRGGMPWPTGPRVLEGTGE